MAAAALSATERFNRKALALEIQQLESAYDDWIRTAVLEHSRLDVLAEEVLGLKLEPFHKAMQRFILRNPHSLQLAFRGGGKTTTVTICYTIWRILKDPNLRILIASKTHRFAKDILKEIKAHLEGNDILVRIFGEQKGERWDQSQIEVAGRTKPQKEPTVMTVGAEGQVVGMHYDLILADDLVDESNARTKHMRDQLRTFYNKTLMPTLEPDGEIHFLGTRYHYDDLYGYLEANAMNGSTQIIRALDERGRSPWPSKYPAAFFRKTRNDRGTIAFNSQYLCDTEAMKGEIFDYDWMVQINPDDVPAKAKHYIGVDLAISEKESADCFAMVHIAVEGRMIYVIDHYEGHLTFGKQVRMVEQWFDRIDPVSVAIETNAYQAALAQHIKERRPDIRVRRVVTKIDKITRAWKDAQRFEADEVRIVSGQSRFIDHMVSFPGDYRDIYDAYHLAVQAATKRRKRRKRSSEPGVL